MFHVRALRLVSTRVYTQILKRRLPLFPITLCYCLLIILGVLELGKKLRNVMLLKCYPAYHCKIETIFSVCHDHGLCSFRLKL